MKQTVTTLLLVTILLSCNNGSGSNAVNDAKQAEAGIKQIQPGGIPTTEGGWTMTAKFNGKNWSATSIMPLEASGRIAGDNDGVSISLPYDRREMTLGYKNNFSDHNAVDIFTHDEVGLWAGYKGEMEITKVDGDWREGTFFVTGSTSDAPGKKMEITNGFFRISLADKK